MEVLPCHQSVVVLAVIASLHPIQINGSRFKLQVLLQVSMSVKYPDAATLVPAKGMQPVQVALTGVTILIRLRMPIAVDP